MGKVDLIRASLGIDFKDLHSSESSLEDIFVSLVHAGKPGNNRTAPGRAVKEPA